MDSLRYNATFLVWNPSEWKVKYIHKIQIVKTLRNYLVLWPTNAQLIRKLSQSYMFRHYRIILSELVIINCAFVGHGKK